MGRGVLVLVAAVVVVGLGLWARSRSRSPSAEEEPAGTMLEPPPPPDPVPPQPVVPPSAAPAARPDAEATTFDRAKRDEIRRSIYEAFNTTLSEPADSRRSRSAAEARELDHEYVERHIREDFLPMGRECYRAASKKTPGLEGTLVMTLHVVGDAKVGGIVESTEIDDGGTLRDPEVLDCLQNSMASVAMPPPKAGGSLTIKVPMGFFHRAPDGAAP